MTISASAWSRVRSRSYHPEVFIKKLIDLIGDLVLIIASYLADNPHIKEALGSPFSIKRVLLDIDYPYGPPRDYEQPG